MEWEEEGEEKGKRERDLESLKEELSGGGNFFVLTSLFVLWRRGRKEERGGRGMGLKKTKGVDRFKEIFFFFEI